MLEFGKNSHPVIIKIYKKFIIPNIRLYAMHRKIPDLKIIGTALYTV